jgi:hypothetical protein
MTNLYRKPSATGWASSIALAVFALGCAPAARGEGAETEPGALSSAPVLAPICTDRPTKSNYACTVEQGHVQYESDLFNASSLSNAGSSTDTWLIPNPTVKYGLTAVIDLEANLVPFEIVHTHPAGGRAQTMSGIGDLYLRLKYQFINVGHGDLQVAAIPYIKAPTARLGIGNGAFEGGVIVPVNLKIGDRLILTSVPELDLELDQSGAGRHPNTAQLLNVALTLPRNLTLYGELWADWNLDPSGTTRQRSADLALAWGPGPYVQLDVGVNVALDHDTPTQAYVGISQKF